MSVAVHRDRFGRLEWRGEKDEDQPPGSLHALVLGGGDSVWGDVAALEELIGGQWPGLVIAVNDIGCCWARPLDHWCTLHPEKMPEWKNIREQNGHPEGYTTWGRRARGLVDGTVQTWGGGASGLLAVALAYRMRCRRVVLAGVPMDSRPHFMESIEYEESHGWSNAETHWQRWLKHMDRLKERTKSMSGRSRCHLGAPTINWLEGEDE